MTIGLYDGNARAWSDRYENPFSDYHEDPKALSPKLTHGQLQRDAPLLVDPKHSVKRE